MRLKVVLDTEGRQIPFEYHRFLQAVIYHALEEKTGDFFHDHGYGTDRIFKMFVYSELLGKYKIVNKHLVFTQPVIFYISSISSNMLNELYLYFNTHEYIFFNDIPLKILNADPVTDIIYSENQTYVLKTISPIVSYKTDDTGFTTFYCPGENEFEEALRINLKRKYVTLFKKEIDEPFDILKIEKCKKTIVKYKKFIYQAYIMTMKVHVGDEYFKLLMHTGLGSRNSAGFGMMQIKDK